MTTTTETIRRGCRVETTGFGRTAYWGHYTGRVTSNCIVRIPGEGRVRRIHVVWDGGWIEDQMDPREVRLVS